MPAPTLLEEKVVNCPNNAVAITGFAGIQAGDLLIVQGWCVRSMGFTFPNDPADWWGTVDAAGDDSGWEQNPSSTSHFFRIYWKVADGSEDATTTIANPAGSTFFGQEPRFASVQRWTGYDALVPVWCPSAQQITGTADIPAVLAGAGPTDDAIPLSAHTRQTGQSAVTISPVHDDTWYAFASAADGDGYLRLGTWDETTDGALPAVEITGSGSVWNRRSAIQGAEPVDPIEFAATLAGEGLMTAHLINTSQNVEIPESDPPLRVEQLWIDDLNGDRIGVIQ